LNNLQRGTGAAGQSGESFCLTAPAALDETGCGEAGWYVRSQRAAALKPFERWRRSSNEEIRLQTIARPEGRDIYGGLLKHCGSNTDEERDAK
jgi:hypothetical protein